MVHWAKVAAGMKMNPQPGWLVQATPRVSRESGIDEEEWVNRMEKKKKKSLTHFLVLVLEALLKNSLK